MSKVSRLTGELTKNSEKRLNQNRDHLASLRQGFQEGRGSEQKRALLNDINMFDLTYPRMGFLRTTEGTSSTICAYDPLKL